MNNQQPETETLTRYLLGDLPEGESARLEDRFLADGALFDRVGEAEDDLVDDYVRGRLVGRERALFERGYLALASNRARVESARALAREQDARRAASREAAERAALSVAVAASPTFWEGLSDFWRGAFRFAPYAAAAVLVALVAGGAWLASRRVEGPGQIAMTRMTPDAVTPNVQPSAVPAPPTPPPAAATPEQTNRSERAERTPAPAVEGHPAAPRATPPAPSITPAPPQTARRAGLVATLALAAGSVRGEGGGGTARLVVPEGAQSVRLDFTLDTRALDGVRASLQTVDGREVWSGPVRAAATGTRRPASVLIPARVFKADDYLLVIKGASAAGAVADLQEFYFSAEVK